MTGSGNNSTDTLISMVAMGGGLTDERSFRETMRSFPSPVAVLTALDSQGLPRGLTCSALCSLSMSPPSILACVNRASMSLGAIRHSGGFAVNLLRTGQYALSDLFASSSKHKFDTIDWLPSPASGLPRLASGILAFIDCQLQNEIIAGSHAILIGRVRSSSTEPSDDGPLVYLGRRYGHWAADSGAPTAG